MIYYSSHGYHIPSVSTSLGLGSAWLALVAFVAVYSVSGATSVWDGGLYLLVAAIAAVGSALLLHAAVHFQKGAGEPQVRRGAVPSVRPTGDRVRQGAAGPAA